MPRKTKSEPTDIGAVLDGHPHREAIDLARDVIREAVPSATESVKWNAPSFATAEHFATFFLRPRTGFQVVLHLGVKARPDARVREEVRDPDGLLEWRAPDRAIVSFRDAADVAAKRKSFGAIVRQWTTLL